MKQKKEWLTRCAIHTVSITLLTLILYTAHHRVWSWLLCSALLAIATIGSLEFHRFIRKKGLVAYPNITMLCATLYVLTTFYFRFQETLIPTVIFYLFVLLISLLLLPQRKEALANLSVIIFGFMYVVFPCGMLLGILYQAATASQGTLYLIFIVAVTKGCDVGGFIGGKLLGKHLLAPLISPKKTIEGAVIGLLFSAITATLCVVVAQLFHIMFIPYLYAVLLGIVLGSLGLIGDLVESLFKRDVGVKDSNHIPEVGGVLDTIDSLVYTIPAFYLWMKL